MASAVSSGHLIWTKCASAAPAIPASVIAARTESATVRAWAAVPSSSERSGRVWAMPAARRLAPPGRSGTTRRAKTDMCGVITPSVPPDMMNRTRRAISSSRAPSADARKRVQAAVA